MKYLFGITIVSIGVTLIATSTLLKPDRKNSSDILRPGDLQSTFSEIELSSRPSLQINGAFSMAGNDSLQLIATTSGVINVYYPDWYRLNYLGIVNEQLTPYKKEIEQLILESGRKLVPQFLIQWDITSETFFSNSEKQETTVNNIVATIQNNQHTNMQFVIDTMTANSFVYIKTILNNVQKQLGSQFTVSLAIPYERFMELSSQDKLSLTESTMDLTLILRNPSTFATDIKTIKTMFVKKNVNVGLQFPILNSNRNTNQLFDSLEILKSNGLYTVTIWYIDQEDSSFWENISHLPG